VKHFVANRSQKRSWKKHAGLDIRVLNLGYQEEHFQLYQRYQNERHAGGDMDQDGQDQYMQFLLQSRVNSRIVEFRDGPNDSQPGHLRMVSMIDVLDQGISSVYTFFDTSNTSASYGSFSILWQIQQALELNLPYLYLGYYIADSQKMSYKAKYQPIEGLVDDHWQPIVGP
jgi:arginine-tRNA-protein transferase